MPNKNILKLSDKEQENIKKFLLDRFSYLDGLRTSFDNDINEEIDLYNNIDKNIDLKEDWEKKIRVPYIYTIVQTIMARLYKTFFGEQNYLRIYIEDKNFKKIEKSLQEMLQKELDKMKFGELSRDFLEDALVKRVCWLQPRPIFKGNKLLRIDVNVLSWYDVWFDTMAKSIDDTDFFVRKIVKRFKMDDNVYINLDKLDKTSLPEIDENKKDEHKAKHGESYVENISTDDVMKDVELLEYYGWYKVKGEYIPVLFVLGNREVLVRAENIDIGLNKKILLFPIRPIRQANSLIGKSIPQLLKDIQYNMNETMSLTLQNFSLTIKLLFKYRKNSGIDFDELFAEGGNAIGWEDNINDISIFPVPNVVSLGLGLLSEFIQLSQQVSGAVDYLMGTSAGRGITETASGIKQITDQAMFKFTMMAQNIYDNILDFINYVLILLIKYDSDRLLLKYPELAKFFELPLEELENSYPLDIGLNDLAMRRDIERNQFINAMNILAGLIGQTGGDMKKFLEMVMDRLGMENIEEILYPQGSQGGGGADMQSIISQILGGSQGGQEGQVTQNNRVAPRVKKSLPEEEVNNENPEKQQQVR